MDSLNLKKLLVEFKNTASKNPEIDAQEMVQHIGNRLQDLQPKQKR
ncbi:hypothetical protein [Salipaludibacillus sp. CF4.18]